MAKLNSKAVKVLQRVLEAGFDTEKSIQNMTMDEILSLPSITVSDIGMINQLQKAVKTGKVVTFLANDGKKENSRLQTQEYSEKYENDSL